MDVGLVVVAVVVVVLGFAVRVAVDTESLRGTRACRWFPKASAAAAVVVAAVLGGLALLDVGDRETLLRWAAVAALAAAGSGLVLLVQRPDPDDPDRPTGPDEPHADTAPDGRRSP